VSYRSIRVMIVFCGAVLVAPAMCQRDLSYDNVVVPQDRVDARDLGYAPVDVIPDGESGITSLTVAPNGDIYGATSGTRAHLFVLNPRHGYVQPLGVIPGVTSVTNAVVVSADGDVYLGTAPDGSLLKFSPHEEYQKQIQIDRPLSVKNLGKPYREHDLWSDVSGGTLFRVFDREWQGDEPGCRCRNYSFQRKV